jgi:hypothetical protein
MSITRRDLLLLAGPGFHAASRLVVQQAPGSQGKITLWPKSAAPSEADRAAERQRDTSQAEGSQFAPHRFLVNASTHQRIGVPFRLATAVLRPGRTDPYRGLLSFRCSDPKALLPATYEFSQKDDLYESHLFQAAFQSEGTHTLVVRDEISGKAWASNPIIVSAREARQKLYFGDIHIHSQWSFDGRVHPDYCYFYARDALNLDFACLTEHDPSDAVWERVKAKAKEFYEAGRFATMSAYEWTGSNLREGHKNVYYRDWEGPILRSNYHPERAGTTSAADLWSKLRQAGKSGQDTMTIPHHPVAKMFPVPWEHYDAEFQRCVEVYSSWGNSEYPLGPRQLQPRQSQASGIAPGHFVQDGLSAGQRLGFVGGSDSHSGRPGYPGHSRTYYESGYTHWEPHNYTGGTTGVYAEDLTREAVFDAIRNRRCYATTGKRIVVDFKIDGHWMGEEFRSRSAPHIAVKVVGTAPIASVTVVKNNQDYLRVEGEGTEVQFEFDKTEPPRETDFYYVRVVQQDFEMAWASPIWISRP